MLPITAQEALLLGYLKIKSDLAYSKALRHIVKELVGKCITYTGDMDVAVGEAIANSIKYGTGPTVTLQCDITDECLVITITNEGPEFDPTRCEMDLVSCGGRGVPIMRNVFDEVYFGFEGGIVTTRLTYIRK
jgi:anti-sigma regulatory factor (Ser/Thr protein kinase)